MVRERGVKNRTLVYCLCCIGPRDSSPSPLRFSALSRHYLRYSVLFRESAYNLIATTTELLPEEDDSAQRRNRRIPHLHFV